MKYVKKQGNKWVFYTENSIHPLILHHSCNCIWPTSDHIWNTLYLYGTPINGDLYIYISSLERVQKFALKVCTKSWSSGYESLLQSCNLPTLACRRRYLKLCLLYKVVNRQLTFPVVPISVPRSQARLLRNTSTLALERPVTRSNASFFPDTIALWNSLPPSVQNCQSLDSFKQTVLCHTLNTYTYYLDHR